MKVTGHHRSLALAVGLLVLSSALISIGTVLADPPLPAPENAIGLPVATGPEGVSPDYTGCGGVVAPVVNSGFEQEVVELTNDARAANGLPPLKRAVPLDQAARYHSTDMGQDDYVNHDSYDRVSGNLVLACAWSSRIQSYYGSYQSLAENVAAGYWTPQDVMDCWMNSSGHRDNILRTGIWEIGMGYFQGSGTYGSYWTQDFGRRSGVYPLIINREAATTDSKAVSLYIYGTWSEMRLRNDSDAWTAWQAFQASPGWTLNGGVGEHTVSVELRTGTQTAASSDSIYLASDPGPCYDFNYSGRVDGGDLNDVAARWRRPSAYDPRYDANGDGRVDARDVEPVAAHWGEACTP